jgi:hypothetical protein
MEMGVYLLWTGERTGMEAPLQKEDKSYLIKSGILAMEHLSGCLFYVLRLPLSSVSVLCMHKSNN